MQNYTDPDFNNCALLNVDMQNDFVLPGAPVEIVGSLDIVPALAQLLSVFRDKHLPIVHIVRLYHTDGSNVDLCRRARVESGHYMVAPGSDGAELVSELKPDAGIRLDHEVLLSNRFQQLSVNERIMYKPRWGAFYQTPLKDYLDTRNINTLIVAGCNYPNCPRSTIYEASERDYRIVLVDDAVSQLSEQGHREMENIGVNLLSARQIENSLS